MSFSGSVCERAIVLPGGFPTIFATTANVAQTSSSTSVQATLGLSENQAVDWATWRGISTSIDTRTLEQIARDIPFSDRMGVGLWYFGRVPFLARLQESAVELDTQEKFAQEALQTICLGRIFRQAPTLPGYLNTMAVQLSIRNPDYSALQWRIWLDFALSFSFPVAAPAVSIWREVEDYVIPVPGSPRLVEIKVGDIKQIAPNVALLAAYGAAIGAFTQLAQSEYVAASLVGVSGIGLSLLMFGTQSLITFLAAQTEPVPVPTKKPRRRKARK
jgi:hypothetical protein